MRILVLDNYDSFTYNLVHLIEKCTDSEVDVFKNDAISLEKIESYDRIVLSPGPGLPSESGIMPELLKTYVGKKNIFGVCLGMQAIGEHFGAKLKNLQEVVHGQKTPVALIADDPLFENCPDTFQVGRYHSWVINSETVPACLTVTAVDKHHQIMAIRHNTLPIKGVQFHPESVMSEYGEQIMRNWLLTS